MCMYEYLSEKSEKIYCIRSEVLSSTYDSIKCSGFKKNE
jgi:hypothetical protein